MSETRYLTGYVDGPGRIAQVLSKQTDIPIAQIHALMEDWAVEIGSSVITNSATRVSGGEAFRIQLTGDLADKAE